MVGSVATGQRPGTYDLGNKITGIVISVRESISDYTSSKPSQILVDIQHDGTVTPCCLETVELISPPNDKLSHGPANNPKV